MSHINLLGRRSTKKSKSKAKAVKCKFGKLKSPRGKRVCKKAPRRKRR